MSINFFRIKTGIGLGSLASAPSSPINGEIYYDSGLNKFQFRQNGAWLEVPAYTAVNKAGDTMTGNLTLTEAGNTLNQKIYTTDNVLNATADLSFGTTPGDRQKARIRMTNSVTGNAAGSLSFATNNGTTITEALSIDQNQIITMSGRLLLADGAVGTPAYSFSGDTNTGIYRPGTDIIGFTTAGTERMRLDTAGIRIGDTAPVLSTQERLTVNFTGISATTTAAGIAVRTLQASNSAVTANQQAIYALHTRSISSSQTDTSNNQAAIRSAISLGASSGTLTNASTNGVSGVQIDDPSLSGTMAITHYQGLLVLGSSGNTGTNKYGIRVLNQTGATNNFAIKTGDGIVDLGDTTDSTSTATGSIRTAGGLGVAKAMFLGGALTINTTPIINLTAAAGTVRDLRFQTSGTLRWIVRANGTAEGGSNAGTDFELLARDDSGNAIDSPITIARVAGGAVTSTRQLALTSNLASTSTTTGSAVITGGIGVSGDSFLGGDVKLPTVGKGLYIKEGSNATMGTATLVGGTVVVSTTKVTANSRIFLTSQADGGTVGFLRVSARTAATSFTITSSSVLDTSTVAWMIVEPA